MLLYLVQRWGNPDSEDGPDGEDTNFLVCAKSIKSAASLVDERLKTMPTQTGNHRPVQNKAHCITELGAAPPAFKDEIILLGPWIAFEVMGGWPKGLPYWHRDHGRWKSSVELFGE